MPRLALRSIGAMVNKVCVGKASGAVAELKPALEAYVEDLLKHLRGEEDHLQGLPRK